MYNLNDLISMIGFFVIALVITGPYFLGKIICPIVHTINERRSDYSKKSKAFSIAIIWIYSLLTIITDIFILFMMRYIRLFFFYLIAQDFIFILLFIFEFKRIRKRAIKTILISMIIVSIINGFFGFILLREMRDRPDHRRTLVEKEIDLHNSEYESYFGDNVTPANVKALLSRIKTNNTLYKANQESSEELKNIYVKINGEYYYDINDAIKLIKLSQHYKVGALNDAMSDRNEADAGYYENGYIKTIVIEGIIKNKDNTVGNNNQFDSIGSGNYITSID